LSSPFAGPRMVEQRLAPPGTPGGDLIDGGDAASALLRPVGPDADIDLSRPPCLSAAAFTPTSARAEAMLSAVLGGDGVLVSTGQQPGLFLGPLYVLYKIFSAVSHARRIEQATGRPAVASFWIAADDHDWEEVGTAKIVDRAGEIETMSIAPLPGDAGRSVGRASLGPEIRPLLDRFGSAAGESDFSAAALAPLIRGYTPGSTVSGAFQSAYAELIEGFDLLLFDPMHTEVRQEAIPFLRQALEYGPRVSEAMREGTTATISSGYDPRLRPPEAGIQVFFDDGITRSHLLAEGAGLRNGKSGNLRPTEEWIALLEARPECFSAAAALRPVLESWLLPVARSILGPGELAYWAQLGPMFELFDVDMPQTAPRSSWIVVEPRVERWLNGVEASVEDLADGGRSLERRITREGRPESIGRDLGRLTADFEANLGRLERSSEEEIPGLGSAFGKARKSVAGALAALERAIDGRIRESRGVTLDRVRRATDLLYPGGQPQERVDSPFSFLARYGPSFLETVAAAHGVPHGEAVE
jgi:bacillithiol biosynthesis cysteine-adding enzyme BshC